MYNLIVDLVTLVVTVTAVIFTVKHVIRKETIDLVSKLNIISKKATQIEVEMKTDMGIIISHLTKDK